LVSQVNLASPVFLVKKDCSELTENVEEMETLALQVPQDLLEIHSLVFLAHPV
jgi:hypothetical protein